MRRAIIVFALAVVLTVHAQTATSTAGTTTTVKSGVVQLNANGALNGQGQAVPDRNYPTMRIYAHSNYPPYRNFGTNQNFSANTNQNQFGQTNQVANGVNAFSGVTNGNNPLAETNAATYNASITNTLAAMAPQQAQNVVQFQTQLGALQQAAVNSGVSAGLGQNLPVALQQNAQVQAQLQQTEMQISVLAQGQVKPASETVQRLVVDLLRADIHAQLTSNQQLVLATVINQMANSETMTAFQIQSAINSALANLEGAGVPRWVSFSVGADLRAMALELQPNLQMEAQ